MYKGNGRFVSQSKSASEVACRAVCVAHALESCALSAVSNLVVGPWVYTAVGEPNTPLQSAILEISLGYFLFDLIVWCIMIENESTLMMVHPNIVLGLRFASDGRARFKIRI